MRRIVSSTTLVMEAFVVAFTIVLAKDSASGGELAALAVFAVVLLAFPGVLSRPGAYVVASLLQVLLVLTGLIVTVMWFLGVVFAVIWFGFLALSVGVERDQRARAAASPSSAGEQRR